MYLVNGEEVNDLQVFLESIRVVRGNIWDKDNVLGKVAQQMLNMSTRVSLNDNVRNVQLDVEYVYKEDTGVILIQYTKSSNEWIITLDGPLSKFCKESEWYKNINVMTYHTTSSKALLDLLREGLKRLIGDMY